MSTSEDNNGSVTEKINLVWVLEVDKEEALDVEDS